MTYKGVLFPLRLKANGDFETGTQEQVIKSDIKMCLWTRRFVDLDIGGERVMRPGAFGLIPLALFQLADMDILIPAYKQWLLDALQTIIDDGRIKVNEIRITPILSSTGADGLTAAIRYTIVSTGLKDNYSTELGTLNPASIDTLRRF